ncbi:MAG: RNA 2',3'-cyclic phosphodiesterase [Planctomycetes bacterium]|nr:RNA 2',3'-cyclic phosphodiesterase [Planctomycetota bacterium]
MRCFVAVELEQSVRSAIARFVLQELPAGPDVRWCGEDQLHITLKFLGDVDDARLSRVCEIVSDSAKRLTPFDLTIGRLGCFPPRGSPRVMWMGVADPDDRCAKWVAAADVALVDLGFERERRAFTPHITLGRAKNRAGGALVARLVDTMAGPPPMTMQVKSLTVFESRLSPSGARYHAVSTAPFRDRGPTITRADHDRE